MGRTVLQSMRRSAPAAAAAVGVIACMFAMPAHASAPPPAEHYPMYILQLNATDETGHPANNADVQVFNTDDVTREKTDVPIVDGIGRIAVPAGHYSAFAFFVDGSPKQPTAGRVVTVEDFTVSPAKPVTTVSVDERTASDKISVTAPRPATEDLLDIGFYRRDAAGGQAYTGSSAPPGVPLYVSPAPAAKVGRLHYVVQWGAMGPGVHPAYRYDVAFAFDHVPADEAFKVLSGQLATVHQHFSDDPAGARYGGELMNGPVDAVTARGVPTSLGVNLIFMDGGRNGEAMPGDLTDYLGTADGDRWAEMVNNGIGTGLVADVRTFRAGHTYSVNWMHGPLAPGLGQHQGPQACLACLAGHTLTFGFSPQDDSEPDHATWQPPLFQPLLPGRLKFSLYRNGVQIASSARQPGLVVPGVTNGSATFRAVLNVDESGSYMTQSTRTETDLSVPSNPADTARLPAEDSCAGGSARTPCRILPALTLSYQLVSDEGNTSRATVQAMGLRVGHISYDGAGSRAAIRSAAVWVSFDHGATWRVAAVRGSSGQYAVSWENPASARGTDPAIRVTASDALGGSITQTIFNAYTIAPSRTVIRVPRRSLDSPSSAAPVLTASSLVSPVLAAPVLAAPVLDSPSSAARTADVRDACPVAAPGQFRCFAEVRTDVRGGLGLRGPAAVAAGDPVAARMPQGFGPADLRSAYELPAVGGRGQTVAIVDAGDDPRAEADLAIYRATYGLPKCTTANGCFRKVNQYGNSGPLPPDQGWAAEISLDLDMISAACPSCHILLVEGEQPTIGDLATAERTATRLGASVVSNSYGAQEQNGIQPYQAAYSHPGTAIVASSGDSGYGTPVFPAVFQSVIAVGGTSLTRSAGARGWTEAAWSGAGSGCSAWIPKPTWQHDPNCPGRMVADVAADADPQTGVAIYDSYNGGGWMVGGGTSASSPFIAGVIALAGNAAKLPNASYLYAHARALNDVVTGSNAQQTQCGGDYLCTAVPGYDGPTGNGTPHTTSAF